MKPIVLPDLYGIIGNPIAHSLSPVLHTSAFQALSIPAVLLPWRVTEKQLASFVEMMKTLNIKGCCVTLPHKKAILPLLDELTPEAKAVGAVNTLFWSERDLLCGENTDVQGFIVPLINKNFSVQDQNVLILGSGGAARAAIVGLKSLKYTTITISSRNNAEAQKFADEFGIHFLHWERRETIQANFIINATPVGMQGVLANKTPYPRAWLRGRAGVVYDMVYIPAETPFCRDAKAEGWTTLSGQTMFFAQASAQFTLWTGCAIPETVFTAVRQILE